MISGIPLLNWRIWPAPPPDHNGPVTVDFDPPGIEVTKQPIFESLSPVIRRQADAVALRDQLSQLTYAALDAKVTRLTARLSAKVARGAAVAILLESGVNCIVAQLACIKAGLTCLVPNLKNPPERLALILENSGATAAIAENRAVAHTLGLPFISIHDDAPEVDVPASLGIDEPAFVFYTSGSTGRPKGVARSQRQVLTRARGKILQLHINRNDRILSLFNCAFTPGLMSWHITLLAGAELTLLDLATVGARSVLQQVQGAGITVLMATPSVLRMLLQLAQPEMLATVRALFTTGEPLSQADIVEWRRVLPEHCAIAGGYAMTEVSPIGEWFVPPVLPSTGRRLPAGYADPMHEYALADPNGGPAADGEPGVLWLRGEFIALGEWLDGQCVSGRLLPDPDNKLRMVFYTGDVVRLRPDGLLEVLGRADSQVKIRGNRVDPTEVEEVVRGVEGVTAAAVIPVETSGEIKLFAYVVATGQSDETELRITLQTRLNEALPAPMHPARTVFLSEMPYLPSGKVDRRALTAIQ